MKSPAPHLTIASDWNVIEADLPPGVMGASWLHPDDGAPMVAYARGLTPNERRWTIAHELAHLIFDRDYPGGLLRDPEREARADRFAAELVDFMSCGAG